MDNKINIADGFTLAIETVNEWVQGFYALIPNIIAGLFIFIIFAVIAWAAKFSTLKYFTKRQRIDLGRILSSLSFWVFTGFGIMLALTIIIPSLKPANLVASLGVGSLAIGFVFKDILQNWLSGLLILLRLPFRRGDQITIGDAEGTVVRIDPRATVLRTYDGRDIVVPNNTVYSSNVMIHTSSPTRRVEMDLTVGYNYDIRVITRIIENSLNQVDEILKSPPPQILCWELGATSLGIKIRWWVNSEKSEQVISRARVVQAIKEAFDANNIDPTDPQLIYYQKLKAGHSLLNSDASEDNLKINETTVAQGPPPPEFTISKNDPEAEQPKLDSKSETMLSSGHELQQ